MGDTQQEPDTGHGEVGEGAWHPPNQNAAIMAEATPAVASRSQNGVPYVEAGHLGQGYVAVAGQFDATSYQELRPSFSGGYSLNAANQPDLFQAAHSTYGRMTPPTQNGFAQHDHNDSEAIPAYSTISADNAAQIIAASTVDSSTLQQGYLVLDQDSNTVMAVQRVVSPADCTVSQSTLSMGAEGGDGQPSTTLLTMPAMSSGNAQYVMQVTMPAFSSHGEVSTSSNEPEPSVSSLGAAFQPTMLGGVRKVEMECTSGECDTTQEDLDCAPHDTANSYLHAVSLGAHHTVGMESGGLHTTMMAVPRTVSATVTSADLPDHATIHSSQLQDLHNVAMAAGPSTERAQSSSGLGRVVDEDAISNALEEAMVSDSGVTESNMVDSQAFSLMAATEAASQAVAEAAAAAAAAAVGSQDVSDEKPSTSGTVMASTSQQTQQTRKSSRLAQYQREEVEHRATRQQYEPRQYTVQELWCEECQTAYLQQCPIHRLTITEDKVVLSRAWASLPSVLQIFRLGINVEDNAAVEMGVFAKKPVPKMTQFGPFVADIVNSVDEVTNKSFLLMLERDDGTRGYFETQDENKCNWMMFVRPAETYAEQNLVAYQHGQDIFFTVIKNIELRQELKVWYAAHYAERLGQKAHELTEADWALLDQQASRFQCSACSSRFRTSMALQRHLLEHEREEAMVEEEKEEEEGEGEDGGRKGRRKAAVKNYLLKTKNGDGVSGYQWKKKSTTMYINKTRKKYQKRNGAVGVGGVDRMRQTIKSMYRRRGRGVGGRQEWVCTYCDLTFDNNNVLNLHTLTHAAEDVGQEEKLRRVLETSGGDAGCSVGVDTARTVVGAVEFGGEVRSQDGGMMGTNNNLVSLETSLKCPMCHVQFDDKQSLIHHAAEHAKAPRPDRPFKCNFCWKGFTTKEKLQKHLLCHGAEDSKPLACEHCKKRFMNNSALACHLKTHSEKKYYTCPICHEGYDHISCLKQHLPRHKDANGHFTCPYCFTAFEDYNMIRKHMRNFHSEKQYICPDPNCGRVFPRPDKLKLHMLRHTNHREFMCETCGRQFKRKDKLKEHMKRMHSSERETRVPIRTQKENSKKFIPKVLPSDYLRFIYKCNTCMLGFKRRGMLVNHLNKRHPNIKPESVHELNLPILKHQRDYYCQHCDKVYKSSSKRKSHILKNHPGAELPASGRKKPVGEPEETPGILGSTYSQTIGSVTTMPHSCEFCHKQYASKAKLMQHQRKSHSDLVPAVPERRKSTADVKNDFVIDITVAEDNAVSGDRYEDVVVAPPNAMGDGLPQADLLTQAMTELISTHADFRTGNNITVHAPETIQLGRIVTAAGPTLLQVQPNGTLQPATIELSQLTQALTAQQFAAHPTQLPAGTTLIAAPSNSQQPQVLSTQPVNISMVTGNGAPAIPVSIHGNQAFVPRTWASSIQTFQRQ